MVGVAGVAVAAAAAALMAPAAPAVAAVAVVAAAVLRCRSTISKRSPAWVDRLDDALKSLLAADASVSEGC